MGGPTSPQLLLAGALVIVVGFQVITHVHWFRNHAMGTSGGVPCPDETGRSSTLQGVVLANGVLRPPAPPSFSSLSASSNSIDVATRAQEPIASSDMPDAGCGDDDIDLLIAVLGAPTERSRVGRQSKSAFSFSLPPFRCL